MGALIETSSSPHSTGIGIASVTFVTAMAAFAEDWPMAVSFWISVGTKGFLKGKYSTTTEATA